MRRGLTQQYETRSRVARWPEWGRESPRFTRPGSPLIRQAVLRADRGMVFDNSKLNEPPRLVLLFASGRLAQAEPVLPDWVLSGYAEDLVV